MVNITIGITDTGYTTKGSLTLNGDATEYINLGINGGLGGHSMKTLNPEDAKALRDALNEIYPLEFATVPEPSEYTTRFMFGRWEIVHEVPSTDTAVVGYADDSESAARIAQALNETEGL